MTVTVTAAPDPLVTLEQAKAHLRVDHSDDDTLIGTYIAAASAHIDGPGGWLGRAVGVQTLEYRRDEFWSRACEAVALPFPPIISVTSVKYLDTSGVEQTIDPGEYELTGGSMLRPVYSGTWPTVRSQADAVRIVYQAGSPEVPAAIVAAVLLIVGDLYQNRETTTLERVNAIPMSTTVERLLSPLIVWSA